MRKFLDGFTATHITAIVIAALFVPGAIYAADAFTRVVIQDTAGRQASVVGGKLNVYDPVADPLAGYAKDPNNFVRFQVSKQCMVEYRVPAGKALVIQAMTATMNSSGTTTVNLATLDVYIGAACNNLIAEAVGSAYQSVTQTFGSGIVVPAGSAVTSYHYETPSTALVYGYLVPASAVSAAAEAPGAVSRRTAR